MYAIRSYYVLELSNSQAAWVQMAFYGGYFCMALPAAIFMRKYSYKVGILIGLALYATGALFRITSYNVCYTKLLRIWRRKRSPQPPLGSSASWPDWNARRSICRTDRIMSIWKAEKIRYAGIIHDEALRLTRLLNDLLDLSVLVITSYSIHYTKLYEIKRTRR